ncbi:hypothetical protein C8Q74DRAFT_1028696 [Fomes fomentarius]|nr:hypothetical protein C8Q74DRAFT_1028696 [Fomes fomentarius]
MFWIFIALSLSLYLSIPWSLCLCLYYLVALVRLLQGSRFPTSISLASPSTASHTHSLHPPSPFPRSHMTMGRSTSTSYLPSRLCCPRGAVHDPATSNVDVIPDGLTPRSHLIGHIPNSVAPPPPLLPRSAGDLEVQATLRLCPTSELPLESRFRARRISEPLASGSQPLLSLYETHTSCITATAAPCFGLSDYVSPLPLPPYALVPFVPTSPSTYDIMDPRTPDSPFTIPTDLLNHSARRTS